MADTWPFALSDEVSNGKLGGQSILRMACDGGFEAKRRGSLLGLESSTGVAC